MDIRKNTVSAINQMINSSELSFLGDKNAKLRILVVGNSITRHGPNKEIGWECDWGMAASAPEKDYVHRLYAKLTESGKDVYMRIRQASYWERHYYEDDILSYYEEEHDFFADIVVFRLGENISSEPTPELKECLKKFIAYICPPGGRTIYSTCFWKNPIVDKIIEEVASERGEVCIDGGFSIDEKNMALGEFEHNGVAMHPSDKGMEAIAQSIFEAIK